MRQYSFLRKKQKYSVLKIVLKNLMLIIKFNASFSMINYEHATNHISEQS